MRCSTLRAAALGLALCSAASVADCQEWTRFRGPNGQGLSDATGLPATWTAADHRWSAKLPGTGHSSPVLWGDRMFLLSADPQTAERYVLCLSAVDGRELWRRAFRSTPHHLHDRNTYASSTPAVDAQRVYIAWAAPESVTLLALDHDGNDVWQLDLGRWVSQHGFGTSPMVFEDMVFLLNDQQAEELDPGQTPGQSHMLAFDARDGRELWRKPLVTVRTCYSTPCIHRPADGPAELICTTTGEGVFSLDPATGRENWKLADAFSMRVCSSPLIAGGLILGSTGSGGGGGNRAVAVRPGRAAEVAYTIRKTAPYVPTTVSQDGLLFLFGDGGYVSCADLMTGDFHWQERLSRGFSGSPVIADGKLYCIDDEGTVLVLAAKKEFQLLARNPLGEPSRSTPAVAGGRLYFRTLTQLICVGGR